MKRVLALALVGGALLLGGCDRSQAAPPAARPAAATASPGGASSGAASSAGAPNAGASARTNKSDKSGSADVDSLLSDVDKQLSSDDQPPADQD